MENNSSTFILPGSQLILKSFLNRSTIIRFSDLSFRLLSNSFAFFLSCFLSLPLALVPLIGLVETLSPDDLMNLSGEPDNI